MDYTDKFNAFFDNAIAEYDAEPKTRSPLFDGMRDGSEASARIIPPREWFWDGWIGVGYTTLLSGDGGVGKTLLAQQISNAVSTGKSLFGYSTTPAKVLAFYCEDDNDELDRRQSTIVRKSGQHPDTFTGYSYQSRFGKASMLGAANKITGSFEPSELFNAMRDEMLRTGARLLILDNIHHLFGADANDNGMVTRFMAMLNGLALEVNGSVLLLGHVSRAQGSEFAGAASWGNAARGRIFMARPKETVDKVERNDRSDAMSDKRIISKTKANYGREGDSIDVTWSEGAFEGGAILPRDPIRDAGIAKRGADREDEKFLCYLGALTNKGRNLSVSPNASNYAPKAMIAQYEDGDSPLTCGTPSRRIEMFARAMGRLLNQGVIVGHTELWTGKDRKVVKGIARTNGEMSTPNHNDHDDVNLLGCAEVREGGCSAVPFGDRGAPRRTAAQTAQVIENVAVRLRHGGAPRSPSTLKGTIPTTPLDGDGLVSKTLPSQKIFSSVREQIEEMQAAVRRKREAANAGDLSTVDRSSALRAKPPAAT